MSKNQYIGSNIFTLLLAIYALIYHPIISGLRLVALGIISKQDLMKCFIPFWPQKFYKSLYFDVHTQG